MKKVISLIMAMLIVLISGCGKEESKPADTKTKTQTQTDAKAPATPAQQKTEFLKLMETNKRPVAVMIDNDGPSSRPQIGLESAYMVYEVIVEGGASRLMALFKDASAIEKVGPIRSSRHYFLDFVMEHNAIYCHAGWSPKAANDISALGINNVNGIVGNDGTQFYRDSTYDNTWHNLYTNLSKLYNYAVEKKGYESTTDGVHTPYNTNDTSLKEGAQNAAEIILPYSTMYKVTYKYDAKTKVYTRYIGQSEHMSQTGEALTAKNIIVCSMKNYPLQDGENKDRQEVVTVGSGEGYYITNGKAVKITWSKSARGSKTVYKLENGQELKLNPGNTYVQIMPLSAEITIK